MYRILMLAVCHALGDIRLCRYYLTTLAKCGAGANLLGIANKIHHKSCPDCVQGKFIKNDQGKSGKTAHLYYTRLLAQGDFVA